MRSRRNKSGDKLAYGLSFLFFGLLFLFSSLGLFTALHVDKYVMDWRNFFLYAGIIFIAAKKEKALGLTLLAIGVAIRYNHLLYSWLPSFYPAYFWPVVMIVTGAILLFLVLKK